jgi:hypothetical protein
MRSQEVVTPVKTGVQKIRNGLKALDSGWSLSAPGGPE